MTRLLRDHRQKEEPKLPVIEKPTATVAPAVVSMTHIAIVVRGFVGGGEGVPGGVEVSVSHTRPDVRLR
jgi:hypothetical protein